ncbi:MAG: NAD-dependent epimerase/dehydratase family protein, partial [Deltaproteobacteria bacterium]|nr:NAD-dependent epimerase/dehydratase family protein [Deltaproteobacteria bacterium]
IKKGESIAIIQFQYDYTCNFRCEHCSIERFRFPGRKEEKRSFTPKDVRELATQADELGLAHIVITGGEPLMFPDFDEIVAAFDPQKFYISSDTNGWLLDEKKAVHLKSIGVDKIQLSLDSLSAVEHDRFRGAPNSHQRALHAIDAAQSAGLNIIVQTVVTKQRVRSREFIQFLEFLNGKGVGVFVTYAKPVGAWEGNFNCLVDKDDMNTLRELEKTYNVFTHLTSAYGLDLGCIAVKRMISITKYGDVLPCPYIHASLGNFFDEPLKTIIDRGLNIKYFGNYVDTCLVAEDREFIHNIVAKKISGRVLPVPHNEVFAAEDFIKPSQRRLFKPRFVTQVLTDDLSHILNHTQPLWEELRGKRLFITGGTGFFGRWLLESFMAANERFGLKASAVVLTRDYDAFRNKAPHLADNPAIQFHIGDIRNFTFPDGQFSHIIHAAATSAMATFNNEDALTKFDTVVEGTRHTLDFAVKCGAKKLLYTSSGAIYGKQPSNMSHISEEYAGAVDPSDIGSVWGEGKRAAELFCAHYSRKYGLETKVARCFSFVGPYLPLDIHYAIGNFILDALKGGPIQVHGDGTPYRSYLFVADLTIWLWTILFKGQSCRPYNVGSEEPISILELAKLVAGRFQKPVEVRIMTPALEHQKPERYIPSTRRAQKELGVRQMIDLKQAVDSTLSWFASHF